ncbi:MAG: hypothetical protein K2N95_10805 [Lachnospiraceae bacterium]|nr:hypothetical protein [Lachnospiraceae bacterium]
MERKVQKCKQCGRIIYFDGICVSCRAENERNEILAWSQDQIDAAVQKICDEIAVSGKLDRERQLFTNLVNYRDADTTEIARTAFEKQLFYPGELYKDAPDDVVQSMIGMLQQDDVDSMLANHLLLCLAIHGGETVFRAFAELKQHPRKWREKLHVDPSVYATYGGWSYDSSGSIFKTNFDKCYPMIKGTLDEKAHSPVKIGARTNEKCPHCGCTMVNLMEFDGRDSRLDFLGIKGVIKAKCCPDCVMWSEDNFCRYTIDGESEVVFEKEPYNTENYMREENIAELDSNSYILGDAPVPPRYAADWEGGSSVGGVAFWIQDCVIKCCPDCGKPMKYLAQIQWDTVLSGMEGNAYIELCRDCQVMAVLHQQT